MIINRSIRLRMRNNSYKVCKENQNKHCVFNIFFSENCAIYEIRPKNIIARQTRDDNRIRCMHIIVFPSKNGYSNAPQYYVYMYILPVLLFLMCTS